MRSQPEKTKTIPLPPIVGKLSLWSGASCCSFRAGKGLIGETLCYREDHSCVPDKVQYACQLILHFWGGTVRSYSPTQDICFFFNYITVVISLKKTLCTYATATEKWSTRILCARSSTFSIWLQKKVTDWGCCPERGRRTSWVCRPIWGVDLRRMEAGGEIWYSTSCLKRSDPSFSRWMASTPTNQRGHYFDKVAITA
jgi:hypothetical protein